MRKRTQQEVCSYLFSENEYWGVLIPDRWAEEKHGKSWSVVLVLDRKVGHTPCNSAGLRWWGVVPPPRGAESKGRQNGREKILIEKKSVFPRLTNFKTKWAGKNLNEKHLVFRS